MTNSKLRNLVQLVKESKRRNILFIAILAVFLKSLLRQGVTFYLGSLANIALDKSINQAANVFLYLIAGILILLVMDFISNNLFGKYTNEGFYRIRAKTIKAVQVLPLTSIMRYTTGDLISRMNNDLGLVEKLFGEIIQDSGYKITVGIFAVFYGFYLNYKVTIFLIVIISLVSIINYKISKPIKSKQEESQINAGEITNVFQDTINGQIEIKTFNLYDTFIDRFKALVNKSVKKQFEMARIECLWGAIEITASIGVQIGTVFICLFFVLRNEMSLGDMIIFQQIQEMVRNIFKVNFIDIGKAIAASGRIVELWEEKPEKIDGRRKEADKNTPIISLKDISFSYQPFDRMNSLKEEKGRLNRISFELGRNEKVAIVGPSGCGKTTLIKLICGFVKPDSGELYYKGSLIEDWDISVLRQDISLVDQDAYIFPASIFDNIACGIYGQSENGAEYDKQQLKEAVQQAVEHSYLKDFIDTLDSGYDTYVGEFGSKLSGGQKQRLAIARAFIKNSDLLIFDEPTSALDAQAEQEIQASLDCLSKNKAVIIVTHRLSLIKNVDRILVLNDGSIVEQGTHDDLLGKKGFYYRLYQQQGQKNEELAHGA